MAITNALNLPRNSYTATSSQTAFAVGFEFYQVSDIKVYKNGSLMTYNASPSTNATYSITGTASSSDSAYEFGGGGTVTFGSGLVLNDIVVIVRDIAVERTVDFNPSSAFDITTLNTQLDTIIGMIADREKQGDRSVKLLDTDTVAATVTLPLKATRASKVLSFDSSGNTETTLSTANLSTLTGLTTELTALAGVSTEIGRLGATAVVADMAILGTSAIVADMAILGTDAVVADMAILATSAIVTDMSILGTADVVSDMNVLATADVVSDMNTLGTSDVVSDLNTLASSTVVTNIATVASNVAGVNSFAARYRVTGGDPGSDNDAGDLNYNTSSNALKYWTGSAWTTIASSYSIDTATDTNLTSVADGAMLLYDTATSKWIDNVMSGDATMADTGIITVGADAITYAKMQNVSATDRILGRDSSSAGVIEEITPTNLRTMINVADGSNAYVHPNHSGEVTSTADGATVIAGNVVDEANLKVSNAPTNGYMLTAQSAATGGMTWAEAGGGATTLLSTVTTSSNGATIEISIPSGYNSFILDIVWRHGGGGNEKLFCTLKRSGESSYDTSYGYSVIDAGTAGVYIDTNGADRIEFTFGIKKGDSGSTRLFLNNFGTTGLLSSVHSSTIQASNDLASSFTDGIQVSTGGGAIEDGGDNGDVITHLKLGLTGDEFPAGQVYRLYGIT